MPDMSALLNDHEITERVLSHIANRSTDAGDVLWREPVENYRSKERFEAETERVLRRSFSCVLPVGSPSGSRFIHRTRCGRQTDRGGSWQGRRGARVSERLSSSRHAFRGGQRLYECIRVSVSRLDIRAERMVAAHPACRRLSGTRQGTAWSRAAACCRAPRPGVRFAGIDRSGGQSRGPARDDRQ